MLELHFAKPVLPDAGVLAILLAEEDMDGALLAEADAQTGGVLKRALAAAEFKGKTGSSASVLACGPYTRVLAIGLGARESINALGCESAGAALAAALAREASASVEARAVGTPGAAQVATGAALRHYRFDRYRTTEKPEEKPRLAGLTLLCDEPAKAKAAWALAKPVVEGVFLTRDLVSEPPNVLTPAEFAERCKALLKLGVSVEIIGPKEMKKLGFGTFLGVAQGSANEPRMVTMRWQGTKKRGTKPLAFIGKGITFDTGGISIKPAAGMEDMKWDMAGAGTVVGLIAALAGRKAKVDAIGMIGLAENMPSGTAQRPGDVVKSASGQTVEIINTDAEGRLVLADVLWHCKEKHDPRFMVDLATLTGAIIIALGHEHAGLFANDDALAQQIVAAGQATGEACWRMPLGDAYDKQIKSDIADMKNVGTRAGGSITAAQFLQRFVDKRPWAHLDIAGTAWATKEQGVTPKGATAFGVRLLDRLVADHYEG
jgi:leucyl aminopeptidase